MIDINKMNSKLKNFVSLLITFLLEEMRIVKLISLFYVNTKFGQLQNTWT